MSERIQSTNEQRLDHEELRSEDGAVVDTEAQEDLDRQLENDQGGDGFVGLDELALMMKKNKTKEGEKENDIN